MKMYQSDKSVMVFPQPWLSFSAWFNNEKYFVFSFQAKDKFNDVSDKVDAEVAQNINGM